MNMTVQFVMEICLNMLFIRVYLLYCVCAEKCVPKGYFQYLVCKKECVFIHGRISNALIP